MCPKRVLTESNKMGNQTLIKSNNVSLKRKKVKTKESHTKAIKVFAFALKKPKRITGST